MNYWGMFIAWAVQFLAFVGMSILYRMERQRRIRAEKAMRGVLRSVNGKESR